MLTREPTNDMIEEWKRIYEKYHTLLKVNRKSGTEVDAYFRSKYTYQLFDNLEFQKIVKLNILENDFSKNKLPKNTLPTIRSYQCGNVFIGIDLCSGEFHVESEDSKKAISIYDDLFVYRGLDEEDLKNFFLVAEYVKLSNLKK